MAIEQLGSSPVKGRDIIPYTLPDRKESIMDITNLINLICAEMAADLSQEQLQKLEAALYKHFRNLKVLEECTDLDASPMNGDVALVKMFIASKRLAGRSDKTLEQYNLEIWIARTTIGKAFRDITTLDIKMYLAQMLERGLSPVTLNNKRRYLNSFFAFLHNEGYIEKNPMTRIEAIAEPQRKKYAYSASDLEAMRMNCENPRDRAIFEFLLATGIRVSEATSLKIKDIDFEHRRFSVVGKGNKERVCFFDGVAEYHLLRYIDWREGPENVKIKDIEDHALFAKTRYPFADLNVSGLRAALKRVAEDAGVDNVHPHRFRRTFATTALHRNVPIEKVRGMLGHTKIETTLIYNDDSNDLEHVYRSYMS